MKRFFLILTLASITLLCVSAAVAGDKTDKTAEPKLDGKQLYKSMCKGCHGVDSDAGEYTPMFLIQEQWDVFFDEDYDETHKGLSYDDEKKTEVLKAITPEMLKLIRKFCNDGAADSEHPMTCG